MNTEQLELAAVKHAEREHAPRSASQLGSLVLCEGFRPKKTTARKHWVTIQGERCHVALDQDDDSNLETEFEQRMVDACRAYVDRLPSPSFVWPEIKIHTIEDRWGYADRLQIRANDPGVADLIDWKFVKVKEVVDAEINLQGKDYVVGIFLNGIEREGETIDLSNVHTIHVHFPMPRFGTVTRSTFTRDQLPMLATELFAVLRQAKKSDSNLYRGCKLTPHFDACRHCGAAGNCVALRSIYDRLARQYDPEGYGRLPDIPKETHASQTRDPRTLGQLKTLAAVAKAFAEAVDYHCTELAVMEGVLPEGYVLEQAKGRRKLSSVPALLTVAAEHGVTTDDLLECAKLEFTKLEEVVKSRAPRGQKAKFAAGFFLRLQETNAIERNPDTPKLVRAPKV